MRHFYKNLFIPVLLAVNGMNIQAVCLPDSLYEDSSTATVKQPLFDSDKPLEITIISDFKKLAREKAREPSYQSAVLYLNKDTTIRFNLKIKSRGYARRTYSYCSFPPIMLNFKKKSVPNTIFENQNKLKLVTYCKNTDANEEYVLQEYLIYKVYNLLTDYSLRVRLAIVTYIDSKERMKPVTRFGFFIESDENLAKRNDAVVTEEKLPIQDRCDLPSLDRFTIFQYMIGNTDWWVSNFHNVTLIRTETKAPIPVPFDFDYSGAVNAPYAQVDPNLPIKTVRDRLFRGYCRLPGTYEKTTAIFDRKKDAIYDLYRNFRYLDPKKAEATLKYYDDFYKIIDDPKSLFNNIYKACELKHKHLWEQ